MAETERFPAAEVLKPLIWSKWSRGAARVDGVALGLEQRIVLGSDGGSD
jgi:hypothetical protein